MGLGVGRPPAGVLQSLADVGALEPVGLLAVEAQGAVVDLRQHDPVLGQAQQQVLRHGRDAGGHAQVAHEIVDRGDEVGDPPLVLDGEDVEGDLGGDVGVPVPVAADPRAEAEGPGPHAQVDTQAGQLPGEVLQDVGHDRPAQLLEVVLDGAGLLRRLGLALAQLVGLPHEVDHLGEAALDPVPLHGRGILAGPEQLGHLAHLGEHRPAGGLGGVRREHGAQLEPADDVVDEGRGHPVGLDPVDGLGQETALARGALEVAGLVDLLDDVGQVEPGREGPDQQDLGGQVDAGQHRCQPGVGLGLVGRRGRGRRGRGRRDRRGPPASGPGWPAAPPGRGPTGRDPPGGRGTPGACARPIRGRTGPRVRRGRARRRSRGRSPARRWSSGVGGHASSAQTFIRSSRGAP